MCCDARPLPLGGPSGSDKALGLPVVPASGAGASGPQSLPDLRGWGGSASVSLQLVKLQEGLLGVLMTTCLGVDGLIVPWGKDGMPMFCVG